MEPNSIYSDLNETFQAAMSYVVLSRITNIKQLYLKEFDQKKIYCNKVAKREAQRLRARAINKRETVWDQDRQHVVKISSLNARSLQKHYQDMQKDELIMKSDVICIQETWLESEPKTPITNLDEYYIHGQSRGIALFTKERPIHVDKTQTDTCSTIKARFMEFDLINIYRFSDGRNISQFTAEVIPLIDARRTQIIIGDINIDLIDSLKNLFTETLRQNGFEQIIQRPTHELGGLIDHVYFYSPNAEALCTLYKQHTVFWSEYTCQPVLLEFKSVS